MKATVIVDNKGGVLQGEWGLCIYIEYNGKVFLLDAGKSALFAQNAAILHLPLADVDYAVLSHAHYDHGGGIPYFFLHNDKAKFFLRDACASRCYKLNPLPSYIGPSRDLLSRYADRIQLVSGTYSLADGVTLLPHTTPGLSEKGKAEHMYTRRGLRWQADDFAHEQSLIFHTPEGLVVFNSCCHGGADTVIRETAAAFPDCPVRAVVGGFHLYNKTEQQVRDFARRVKDTGIRYICTGHCTGDKAYAVLQEELGSILHQLEVGLVMDF